MAGVSEFIAGIHHITAIASEPQRNLDFYAGVLGLRLVKRTVNFDDPNTYHFYFGDELGRPGTLLTFFPWPGMARGRPGAGEVMRVLTREGVIDVEVPDPDERSVLGSYWNDVRFYLEGKPYDLRQYTGVTVSGLVLETDPDWIEYWADSGELEFEEIYGIR